MILQHTTKRPNVRIKCLVLGAAAAGKTSLIRRFFYNKFDVGTRVPTLGSDWYTASVESPGDDEEEDLATKKDRENDPADGDDVGPGVGRATTPVLVGIQMWDTPGRERFDAKRQRQQQRPIEDAFLLQADAVMLVYDMTSSTSFTQLLKWFRDLSKLDDRPPILVCANKLDLFETMQKQQQRQERAPQLPHRAVPPKSRPTPPRSDRRSGRDGTSHERLISPPSLSRRRAGSPCGTSSVRDVMGLHGQFRGKDIQYEYQVSDEGPTPGGSDSNLPSRHGGGYRRRAGSVSSNSSSQPTLSMPIYLADRENWTSDGSYLESLLTTEDQSFPDIEMVKLWCLRNGLTHVESSAATGDGVETAFSQLVQIGLAEKRRRERGSFQISTTPGLLESRVAVPPVPPTVPPVPVVRRNDPIDFSKRYAPKEEPCWCLPLLRPVLLLFRRPGDA